MRAHWDKDAARTMGALSERALDSNPQGRYCSGERPTQELRRRGRACTLTLCFFNIFLSFDQFYVFRKSFETRPAFFPNRGPDSATSYRVVRSAGKELLARCFGPHRVLHLLRAVAQDFLNPFPCTPLVTMHKLRILGSHPRGCTLIWIKMWPLKVPCTGWGIAPFWST